MDTDNNTVERQPKTAVLLAIERKVGTGEVQYVFQERLKNPYYGFWGLPTGKVRWGETIYQTAERELLDVFEGGANQWLSFDDTYKKPKKFDSFKMELDILSSKEWLIERKTSYSADLF